MLQSVFTKLSGIDGRDMTQLVVVHYDIIPTLPYHRYEGARVPRE